MPPATIKYSNFFQPCQRVNGIEIINNFCFTYKLRLETQFLALNIFHRINCDSDIVEYHLLLKVAVSLFMAAKYHQIKPLTMEELRRSGFFPANILSNVLIMEAKVLLNFSFNLNWVSPLDFVELFVIRFGLTRN